MNILRRNLSQWRFEVILLPELMLTLESLLGRISGSICYNGTLHYQVISHQGPQRDSTVILSFPEI